MEWTMVVVSYILLCLFHSNWHGDGALDIGQGMPFVFDLAGSKGPGIMVQHANILS